MAEGRGGWVLTPNVELVQQASRDSAICALYGRANLRVPDGAPLLWMARLAGHPFPDRVAGSDLVWLLAEEAARNGRRLFLLGGDEGVAAAAATRLEDRYPGLVVAGHFAPRVSIPPTPEEILAVQDALQASQPDLVFVAFGSPKTEYLIDALRAQFPATWWLGCGISLSFVAGEIGRAPRWVQWIGMEWFHRLLQEPRRLASRYLQRNLPFALRGLAAALRSRGGPPALS
ncbi:MAG: WecB/TagA/CpsF family glycosyltransferase [Deltaproteobacteria bacterium]|nr:WecB/TagA/CpsF family glycosyltransferase [Deltaproteobacteria bacterium]MBW2396916.1 WecB/TagA/CpsF family glycosyltransferase [Deltaproteobacteria bacterium]